MNEALTNPILVSIRFLLGGRPVAIPVLFHDGKMDIYWHEYISRRALCSHGTRVRETRAARRLLVVSEEVDAQLSVAPDCARDWGARIGRMRSLASSVPEVKAALASCRRFTSSFTPKTEQALPKAWRDRAKRKRNPEVAEMVHRLRGYVAARDAASAANQKGEL